jgi:hypothetical protein
MAEVDDDIQCCGRRDGLGLQNEAQEECELKGILWMNRIKKWGAGTPAHRR